MIVMSEILLTRLTDGNYLVHREGGQQGFTLREGELLELYALMDNMIVYGMEVGEGGE